MAAAAIDVEADNAPDDSADRAQLERRRTRPRALRLAAKALRDRLRLPPKIPMSEWADRYRYVSAPAAQPGPWRTERVPYLREIMDTVSMRGVEDVTLVKCSQSGGTEVIMNAIGYYIDQEPSSILAIYPNVEPMAKDFSKDRLSPMIRDTRRLSGRVRDPRARDSGNTILHKVFAGGHITIVGANSPAGLATRPIRIVLADELDRWTASAGSEGDPLSLAEARQITFRHRKKRVKVSSPGNEGESRIEKEWKLSDQRHYYVPCPHCGHEQPLEWRDSGGNPDIRPGRGDYRLVWEKEGEGDGNENVVHKPETAAYVCRECGALIEELHKPAMLAKGRWVKHNPSSARAGFHISGLLSPWVRWSDLAAKWLSVKHDEELRKTFFNTLLGLLYVASGEDFDPSKLSTRREAYAAEVPKGVGLLTAFIDVQGDRIELDVRGWGANEESWHVRLERYYGDPESEEVWDRARATLLREWQHEGGATLPITACFVDTGYKQDVVFRFVKSLPAVAYASKGAENAKHPLSRASKANRDGVKVFTVNPTTFKDVLFHRLKRAVPGPGYMHFGAEAQTGADDAYFLQYAAEKRVVEFVHNRVRVRYVNPGKKRNEAIDHYVGNLAALRSRGAIVRERLGVLAQELQEDGAERKLEQERAAGVSAPEPAPDETPETPERDERGLRVKRGRSGWMRGL